MRLASGLAVASLLAVAGCTADDPIYITPTPAAIEVDPGNMVAAGVSTVLLPVHNDAAEPNEALKRMELATALGLPLDQIPMARRDEYEISIEWTIKNLSDQPGTATISVVGANEYFLYDPSLFVIDPDEDEPPPPLLGGIPIQIEALGTVSGTFREDQLAEAAQDWDAVSRAGVAPQFAMLTRWPTRDVTGGAGPMMEIPSAAIPALVQIDLSFNADQHMVLEYVLRVRDKGERLAPFETDMGTLVPPSTTAFAPPPPAMP